jgi:hypothetical protein
VPARRLDDVGLTAVAVAIADPVVLTRYRAKVATVPGSECLWWTGAVAADPSVSARTAAAMAGSGARPGGWSSHRCHNPLCQRITPEHVVMTSAAQNRHKWSVQRRLPYSPLAGRLS